MFYSFEINIKMKFVFVFRERVIEIQYVLIKSNQNWKFPNHLNFRTHICIFYYSMYPSIEVFISLFAPFVNSKMQHFLWHSVYIAISSSCAEIASFYKLRSLPLK